MCVANYCNTILFPRTWHYIKIYTNIKRSTAFIIENILWFILFSICMLDTGHPDTHLLHPIQLSFVTTNPLLSIDAQPPNCILNLCFLLTKYNNTLYYTFTFLTVYHKSYIISTKKFTAVYHMKIYYYKKYILCLLLIVYVIIIIFN